MGCPTAGDVHWLVFVKKLKNSGIIGYMATEDSTECLKSSLKIDLIKGKESVYQHPVWVCPLGDTCIARPSGKGGEVRVFLGRAEKKWGDHKKIFGVVGCIRVEEKTKQSYCDFQDKDVEIRKINGLSRCITSCEHLKGFQGFVLLDEGEDVGGCGNSEIVYQL